MADHRQSCAFYQGLHLVAVDGTTLSAPDEKAVPWHFRKHIGRVRAFGYPLVRLVALVECGTRALVDAVFGPDDVGELAYARRLLGHLDASMLLLADAYYRRVRLPSGSAGHRGPFRAALHPQEAPDCAPSPARRLLPHRGPAAPPSCQGERAAGGGEGGRGVAHRRPRRRTRRTELWRPLTNLLDADSHPADDVLRLYHRR
ncbi:transposase [Streptomyces sp. NBC_01589]|uniref:transposase n=1 Tax=unclassified Streptomyces TaxID=2593676 RepID=UPI00386A64E1